MSSPSTPALPPTQGYGQAHQGLEPLQPLQHYHPNLGTAKLGVWGVEPGTCRGCALHIPCKGWGSANPTLPAATFPWLPGRNMPQATHAKASSQRMPPLSTLG
eukprot:366002-Chlamydomonas_euryale.AAC.2